MLANVTATVGFRCLKMPLASVGTSKRTFQRTPSPEVCVRSCHSQPWKREALRQGSRQENCRERFNAHRIAPRSAEHEPALRASAASAFQLPQINVFSATIPIETLLNLKSWTFFSGRCRLGYGFLNRHKDSLKPCECDATED